MKYCYSHSDIKFCSNNSDIDFEYDFQNEFSDLYNLTEPLSNHFASKFDFL